MQPTMVGQPQGEKNRFLTTSKIILYRSGMQYAKHALKQEILMMRC